MKNLLICGNSSLGTCLAHHVASRQPQLFYSSLFIRSCNGRQAEKCTMSKHSIKYHLKDERSEHSYIQALCGHHGNESNEVVSFDIAIIALKAHQIKDGVKKVLPFLHENSHIVLFHNGLGTADLVHAILPFEKQKSNLLIGTTTHGVTKLKASPLNTEVRQCSDTNALSSKCFTWVGPAHSNKRNKNTLNEIKSNCISIFDTCFPNTVFFEDHKKLMRKLWLKLCINAVINPLTAVHQVPNGSLLKDNKLETLAKRLCYEASRVLGAVADSYTVSSSDQREERGEEEEKQWRILSDPNYLWEQVSLVIKATELNQSSMLQDILHHRSTEIEFINGYIINTAHKFGISVPLHEEIVQQVLLKTSSFLEHKGNA
ncbi:hypothetical protein RFI_17598 [Reticulomyxa filosa]|uniref:2-dehydropantoate 2-reductase n=1 Tax=Reticulomyxa filosa TaxID=46433 RepID=X6N2T3_RETFI|nr:hypothetical protein RFI_17598 [Reticulomyxa filosa]|eukprot:ETO19627.1 hypothetical protein RFI_17598 [Reticulomyxa filosa]